MAWGSGPFGRTPWGGLSNIIVGSGFFMTGAVAVSANVVRVTFSEPPRMLSQIFPGDASRVMNWSMTSEESVAQFILGVRPTEDPNSVEVEILGRFTNQQYVVAVNNIVSTTADTLVFPKTASFFGCPVALVAAPTANRMIDLRNPMTASNVINGGLVTNSSGQYDRESGVPLLKKLIVRRLTTRLDAFVHLAGKRYGRGLKDKEVFRTSDLATLQSDVEQDVRREPEVKSVTATISFAPNVGPILGLYVIPTTGQPFSMDVPVQSQGQ